MKKVQLHNFLFFAAYSLYLAYSFLGHISAFDDLFDKLNLVVFFILFICFLLVNSYKIRELFILCGFIIFAVIVSVRSQYHALFKLMIFLSVMKYVDFRKVIHFDSKIRIILILFTLFLCKLGIAPNILYSMSDGTIRKSFGFTNPNIFAFHLVIYAIELIYIHNFKLSVVNALFFVVLCIFIGDVIKCRTALLILLFAMLLILIYNCKPDFFYNKTIKFLMCNGFSIFAFLTFILFSLYINGNERIVWLNTLLSDRLARIELFSKQFEFTLLGQDISIMEMSLDNSYAFIYLCCGFITLILFLVLMTYLMYKLYKIKHIQLAIIFFVFSLYGLSEHIWISFNYNVFMLAFELLIYQNKAEKYEPKRNIIPSVAGCNIGRTRKL